MKFKMGDKVKVTGSRDEAVPVELKFIGEKGEITLIDEDGKGGIKGMILVDFGELGDDGFWPEELELVIK